jgi:segregation and condensation protein B
MHSENDENVLAGEVETEDVPRAVDKPLSPEGDTQDLPEVYDEPLDEEDDEDEEDVILNAAMLELGPASDEEPEVADTAADGVTKSDSSDEPEADSEGGASKAEAAEKPKPAKRKKKSKEAVPPAPLREETVNAIEALLFASGDAMTLNEIKRVFARYWKRMEPAALEAELGSLREGMKVLMQRWNGVEASDVTSSRGFRLVHVAEGYAFRSSPEFSDIVRAMREQRPMRLSKPAMEVLSIVAYRQPVTKGEVDFIRGVDCGGTLRILLDRGMVKVVGKREEPGRPLLYGTTREFLNFFNLPTLRALPSLREYRELNADSSEKLKEFDLEHGISEIAEEAALLQLEEEPAVAELSDALEGLDKTEEQARSSLAEHGIALDDEEE